MYHAPLYGRGPASRGRTRPHRVRAFTLVELLVVLGIIAALAGILLPAVNAARHEADAVACTANVRTIGTAALMYAQQHKRYVTFLRVGNRNIDRKELLHPFVTQGRNNRDNEAGHVWQCPANTKVHQVDGLHLEASYGFNTNMNGVRIERVKRPSETVALCDAGLLDTPSANADGARATHVWPPGRPATPSSTRPNHTRHPKGAVSVGFVDGHADRMRMEPPFYPGPAGTYTPLNLPMGDPNYQDRLWDLY